MKTFKVILILLLAIVGGAFIYNWIQREVPEIDESLIFQASFIDYPSDYNCRQTVNDCGPFNVAAVVRALTKESVDSADFAASMKWRLPNKYTLPWGMERQSKENGVSIEVPYLKNLTDEERIRFLQQQLSQKKPVIILGERDNYEHYLTMFGFDRESDVFYLYDSLFDKGEEGFTQDANGEFPGNIELTADELLEFWGGGGMYGFYEWYGIVAG